MKTLITPTANTNGNTVNDMVNQVMDVVNKIQDTVGDMQKMDVYHGRNFQTVENAENVRNEAIDRLVERMNALEKMKMDFFRLAMEIKQQE